MTAPVMLRSDLPGKVHEGKVRELYDLGGDRLLMVASDRISTYDVVMPGGVPRKGEVLTRLSAFWVRPHRRGRSEPHDRGHRGRQRSRPQRA